jgi:hypothetical protein
MGGKNKRNFFPKWPQKATILEHLCVTVEVPDISSAELLDMVETRLPGLRIFQDYRSQDLMRGCGGKRFQTLVYKFDRMAHARASVRRFRNTRGHVALMAPFLVWVMDQDPSGWSAMILDQADLLRSPDHQMALTPYYFRYQEYERALRLRRTNDFARQWGSRYQHVAFLEIP